MIDHPILGKRILLITAHPDDESYLAAGTIYENSKRGGQTILLCATKGEKGTAHLKKTLSPRQLTLLRVKELQKASKFLKIHKVVVLNLPDGQVDKYSAKLFDSARKLINQYRPDLIMSFGRDGITRHCDHIATGKVARSLAKKLSLPICRFALPRSFYSRGSKWFLSKRRSPHYIKKVIYSKPNLRLKITTAIKKKAIGYHKSQMDSRGLSGLPNSVRQVFMKAEYFVV